MECAPKYQFGLFGSFFFAAVVLASVIFAPLADKIGRKPIALAGALTHLIPSLWLLFNTSRTVGYFLLFVIGLAMPMRVFVGYIYCMEFLPHKRTALATALILGIDGLVLTWTSLYFWLLDNSWSRFFSISVLATIVAFILVLSLPESPKFLVTKRKYERARKVISKIAKINGLTNFLFEADDEESLEVLHRSSTTDGGNTLNILTYKCTFVGEKENKIDKHQSLKSHDDTDAQSNQ